MSLRDVVSYVAQKLSLVTMSVSYFLTVLHGSTSSETGHKHHTKMNIVQRIKAPTPKFFRVLRTIGLALAAASGALLAAPVALPVAVITIAGYVAVAGSVVTAVSQTAIPKEDDDVADDDPANHGDVG